MTILVIFASQNDFKPLISDMNCIKEDVQCYLTISPTDEDWGIVVTTVGHQAIQAGSAYPPSRHPDSSLLNPVSVGPSAPGRSSCFSLESGIAITPTYRPVGRSIG